MIAVFIAFFPLLTSIQLQSQILTNGAPVQLPAPAPAQIQRYTDSQGHELSPGDARWLKSQGIDPSTVTLVGTNAEAKRQAAMPPTPPGLKNAFIYMDNFLGMTNANIMADVIDMKAEALKFRLNGQDYEYSGNYTVVLTTPRQHKNPYFGLGSPEKAKFVILEDFGGDGMPLPDATIWEKSTGFIDLEATSKEWIYSGSYTIQN